MVLEKLNIHIQSQKTELDLYLSPVQKINSKGIKDLNVGQEIITWIAFNLKASAQQKESKERLPTEWEKIFASYSSDRGLIPIY
jgi:hypothetical protein